jgi:hypothetical protein
MTVKGGSVERRPSKEVLTIHIDTLVQQMTDSLDTSQSTSIQQPRLSKNRHEYFTCVNEYAICTTVASSSAASRNEND